MFAAILLVNGGLKRRIRSPSVSATHKFPAVSTVAALGSQMVLGVVPPLHLRPIVKSACPNTTLAGWLLVNRDALGQMRMRLLSPSATNRRSFAMLTPTPTGWHSIWRGVRAGLSQGELGKLGCPSSAFALSCVEDWALRNA